MTKNEKRTVMAVFGSLMEKKDSELNTFLGSVTITEMKKLYSKLYYEDYCKRNGIRYEDMTEEDFVSEYLERYEA